MTEDERELTDSQKKKKLDTHPGIISLALLRRRHPWILRVANVRSETEKNSITNDAASTRRQMCSNTLTSKICYPPGSIATELAP